MHRRSIGINVGFIHWLCGVLIILVWSGIFLTDVVGDPIRFSGVFFSEQPVPCKVYLEKKSFHEESGKKSGSYVLGSFFQAEVQVVRTESKTTISSYGERHDEKLTVVKVLNVLEGMVPEEEFIVYYKKDPNWAIPPSETHYFILGKLGRHEDGINVSLVRVEGSFTKKNGDGWLATVEGWLSILGNWLKRPFSACENVH
ncbi:MAG: hypothetical protein R3B74_18045 [Nitrospirales bacterium]|nr:hypothetical protein [Nitrospirales bacterium]